jgi:hypothetical protein
VIRNLKYTKGKGSVKLVAKSYEVCEEVKTGGRLIRNLYQRVKFVHARVVYINEKWDTEKFC